MSALIPAKNAWRNARKTFSGALEETPGRLSEEISGAIKKKNVLEEFP